MTPEQIAARVGALAAREVRVWPDLAAPPHRWVTALRGSAVAAGRIAAALDGVSAQADGEELVVTLSDEQVGAALDRSADTAGVPPRPLRADHPVTLTRDGGRRTTYAALSAEVGGAAARWAVLRSSDGRQVDCEVDALAGLTPRNPVLPVLLATASLARRTPHGSGAGRVAALTAQWPLLLADATRTGRTRPLARHVELLADAVWTWTSHRPPADDGSAWQNGRPNGDASPVGSPFAPWTGERLARASRIVLLAGLSVAGIDAPARI